LLLAAFDQPSDTIEIGLRVLSDRVSNSSAGKPQFRPAGEPALSSLA